MPNDPLPSDTAAEPATVPRWAERYILATSLAHKLTPPPAPRNWTAEPGTTAQPQRIVAPGRPAEFDLIGRTKRSVPRAQLKNPRKRAQLLHTFLHHELQAAELMCWAILAFPESPLAFRQGLLGICLDEIRHMGMYRAHLEHLGFGVGDFPVRDWFWQRVATCATPLEFVALMGMGFEGGNLDHTRRFEQWFREVGDARGADLQHRVGEEEVAHVQFAIRWFRTWTRGLEFATWRELLVAPLTPTMMRGSDLDETRRQRAGFSAEFLASLRSWDAT